MNRPTPHPLKGLVAARGISINSLAERLGVHRVHVGRVLNGRYPMTPDLERRITELLPPAAGTLDEVTDIGERLEQLQRTLEWCSWAMRESPNGVPEFVVEIANRIVGNCEALTCRLDEIKAAVEHARVAATN